VRTGLAASEGRSRGYSQQQTLALAGIGGAPQSREAALKRAISRPGRDWAAMLDDLLAIERRLKTGVPVDGSDFVLFATKWAKRRR
jgi:DNA polymerase III delta subunit